MKTDGRSRYRGYTKRKAPGGKQPITIYLDTEDAEKLDRLAEAAEQAVGAFAKDIVSKSLARRK